MREGNGFGLWLLRRFGKFREAEALLRQLFERGKEDGAKIAGLQKQAESDAALIASLNRYIGALEGRAKMQEELVREMRGRLNALLAAPRSQKEPQQ
jgi:hypothetical protein